MSRRVLSRRFFARDADLVARDLLGRTLVHETKGDRRAARIVETEAYFGPATRNAQLAERDNMRATLRRRLLKEGDPASHSFRGITDRNRVMHGPPGYWYVYLIYGMHECANVVTGPTRGSRGFTPQRDRYEPQAVLLRAAEPVEGMESMPRTDLRGPAKLSRAFGITRAAYGNDATKPPLFFEQGTPVARVDVTARIGVASDLPLRFVEKDSPFASRRPAAKDTSTRCASAPR
jgi:DNA-3-methyladenine glycosylase